MTAAGGGRSAPAASPEYLPQALEGRAPPRLLRCQLSEGVLPPHPRPASFGLLTVSLPGRVSDSAAQLNVEPSPVPRVLLRGDRQFLAAIALQLHLNPPSPGGCSGKADLQAGGASWGSAGACAGRKGKPDARVGRAGCGAAISAATPHGGGSRHCRGDEGQH